MDNGHAKDTNVYQTNHDMMLENIKAVVRS